MIYTAAACAEAIGLSDEGLDAELEGFETHCGSAHTSIRSQIEAIGTIYQQWLVPEITNAIREYRATDGTEEEEL